MFAFQNAGDDNHKTRISFKTTASIGLHWPPLASIGLSWLPLASIGHHCPPMASLGLHWPPLSSIGLSWSLLASVDVLAYTYWHLASTNLQFNFSTCLICNQKNLWPSQFLRPFKQDDSWGLKLCDLRSWDFGIRDLRIWDFGIRDLRIHYLRICDLGIHHLRIVTSESMTSETVTVESITLGSWPQKRWPWNLCTQDFSRLTQWMEGVHCDLRTPGGSPTLWSFSCGQ